MKKGIRKLYSGDWNTLSAREEPDGSITITLTKDGDVRAYRIRVKNLYQEDEEVLEDEVVIVEPPEYLKKRMMEAMKNDDEI